MSRHVVDDRYSTPDRYGRCPWCRTYSVNRDRFQEDKCYCTICHKRFDKPTPAEIRAQRQADQGARE